MDLNSSDESSSDEQPTDDEQSSDDPANLVERIEGAVAALERTRSNDASAAIDALYTHQKLALHLTRLLRQDAAAVPKHALTLLARLSAAACDRIARCSQFELCATRCVEAHAIGLVVRALGAHGQAVRVQECGLSAVLMLCAGGFGLSDARAQLAVQAGGRRAAQDALDASTSCTPGRYDPSRPLSGSSGTLVRGRARALLQRLSAVPDVNPSARQQGSTSDPRLGDGASSVRCETSSEQEPPRVVAAYAHGDQGSSEDKDAPGAAPPAAVSLWSAPATAALPADCCESDDSLFDYDSGDEMGGGSRFDDSELLDYGSEEPVQRAGEAPPPLPPIPAAAAPPPASTVFGA